MFSSWSPWSIRFPTRSVGRPTAAVTAPAAARIGAAHAPATEAAATADATKRPAETLVIAAPVAPTQSFAAFSFAILNAFSNAAAC